jgi:hypothetical protein
VSGIGRRGWRQPIAHTVSQRARRAAKLRTLAGIARIAAAQAEAATTFEEREDADALRLLHDALADRWRLSDHPRISGGSSSPATERIHA